MLSLRYGEWDSPLLAGAGALIAPVRSCVGCRYRQSSGCCCGLYGVMSGRFAADNSPKPATSLCPSRLPGPALAKLTQGGSRRQEPATSQL